MTVFRKPSNLLHRITKGPKTFKQLSIHEYQSMGLLNKYGVPVPRGKIATSPEEAFAIAKSLKTRDFVIKAQVLAGGRGKGQFSSGVKGGVRIVYKPEDVPIVARSMLGHRLITKQTGTSGKPCNSVLVTERLFTRRDYYFAILLDRKSKGILMMGSRNGGMDIEAVAEEEPETIVAMSLDSQKMPSKEEMHDFCVKIDIDKDKIEKVTSTFERLLKLFRERDLTLLEINPFSETIDGDFVCLDAKLNFDENADFRQSEIFSMRDPLQEDVREVRAAEHKLNYIGLEGHIGCLVNGAGLAMATMDIIKLHGGEPANFLDVGGSATVEQVEQAIRILAEDPTVKAILVNIFGGIMKCDIIAQGLVGGVKKTNLKVPLVVRLLGTNVDEAKQILKSSALNIIAIDDLDEAANKAVALAKISELAAEARLEVSVATQIPA